MKLRIFLLIMIPCLILMSCGSTTKIETTQSQAEKEKISKIYIVQKVIDDYEKNLGKYLHEKLLAAGVENQVYFQSPLDLIDNEQIIKNTRDYNADHLLTIYLSSGYSYFLHYKVEITNVWSNELIWSGNIDTELGFSNKASAAKAIDKLIEQLKKDNII